MSKEFMSVCAHERNRLLQRIAATENVLGLYRQLWKTHSELEQCSEHPDVWRVTKEFIEKTVSPSLKLELERAKESLENVTQAQAQGCMELANVK